MHLAKTSSVTEWNLLYEGHVPREREFEFYLAGLYFHHFQGL